MTPINSDLFQQIARRITAKVNPDKVVLFGSSARSDPKTASDIDMLVVEAEPFSKSRSRRDELNRIEMELKDFAVPIDILLYSRAEEARWKDDQNHILARALRDGKVLYERG